VVNEILKKTRNTRMRFGLIKLINQTKNKIRKEKELKRKEKEKK